MESYSDINPFNKFFGNSSDPSGNGAGGDKEPSQPKVKFDPEDLYYDMSGEKLLVIFNHEDYDRESIFYYKDLPQKRTGTEEDVAKLDATFTKLGFTVVLHNNKTRESLWNILLELRERDMSAVSCLCIAILTHGSSGGQLNAYDRTYDFKDVLKLFESHPTLAGKPKLFFVQACRGKTTDDGNRIATDGEEKGKIFIVPSHADFLVMRSTVEDYLCYRDCRGSWMIQEFCKAVLQYHQYLDILHIITFVQKAVAYGYATYTPKNKARNEKRQMPETTFTLTKLLKF